MENKVNSNHVDVFPTFLYRAFLRYKKTRGIAIFIRCSKRLYLLCGSVCLSKRIPRGAPEIDVNTNKLRQNHQY